MIVTHYVANDFIQTIIEIAKNVFHKINLDEKVDSVGYEGKDRNKKLDR